MIFQNGTEGQKEGRTELQTEGHCRLTKAPRLKNRTLKIGMIKIKRLIEFGWLDWCDTAYSDL